MSDAVPAVRQDLNFIPIEHEGERLIMVRDDLGLVQEGIALPMPIFHVLAMLDGEKSMEQLMSELTEMQEGEPVDRGDVEHILGELDAAFLLNTEGYRTGKKKVEDEFIAASVRQCSHAGHSYPAEPGVLTTVLEQIMEAGEEYERPAGRITAIAAPHIDPSIGACSYAGAYGMLKGEEYDRVIILGIAHQLDYGLFSLTSKDFETPFGTLKNEVDLTARLQAAGNSILAPDDFAHRTEHSIEFQLLFLQHILGNDSFTILPILCGSLLYSLPEYSRKSFLQTAGPFLEELKAITQAPDKKTLVVAGVDLSHIGPKFGHPVQAEEIENEAQAHDKALLNHLMELDAEALWEESAGIKDTFNVCGFSAMACLPEILPQGKGMVLNYILSHERPTQSAVGFSAAVITTND